MGSARDTALRTLAAVRRKGAWADAALRAQLDKAALSPPDAALCGRIVYGVLQNRLLLDFYLSAYREQPLERLQPPLPEILRMGAFQILFLDRVPDHAAVHESVELAKRAGRERAAGLVNALLRRLAREKGDLPPLPDGNGERFLSIRYSHPSWLVRRVMELLGEEEAAAFLSANNAIAPIEIQANPLRISENGIRAARPENAAAAPEKRRAAGLLRRELEKDGIQAVPHPFVPGCLELSGTGHVTALPAFQEGRFFVQDPAACLAVLAAEIQPGAAVLDVCAAPGGKSFGAAIAAGPAGKVLACDISGRKLRQVREGAERLGLSAAIETEAADGREARPAWKERFDAVLVDAPCSGLGVIRKKPDIRYRDPAELSGLPELQGAILDNAAAYVRPGGTLLYSTCTVLPEENQDVAARFLRKHPEFSLHTFSLPGIGKADGQITLWPQRHGTDGFYICRMEKSTPPRGGASA